MREKRRERERESERQERRERERQFQLDLLEKKSSLGMIANEQLPPFDIIKVSKLVPAFTEQDPE